MCLDMDTHTHHTRMERPHPLQHRIYARARTRTHTLTSACARASACAVRLVHVHMYMGHVHGHVCTCTCSTWKCTRTCTCRQGRRQRGGRGGRYSTRMCIHMCTPHASRRAKGERDTPIDVRDQRRRARCKAMPPCYTQAQLQPWSSQKPPVSETLCFCPPAPRARSRTFVVEALAHRPVTRHPRACPPGCALCHAHLAALPCYVLWRADQPRARVVHSRGALELPKPRAR